ncbi:MAG TPA: YgjV family protein [Candidatus Paceibacterota bacterium]
MHELAQGFWAAQGVGGIALLFQLLAWNAGSRTGILRLQSVNLATFALHYLLLGAISGAVMSLVAFLRNLVLLQKYKHRWAAHSMWYYGFIVLSIGLVLVGWNGWLSLLPVAAVIVSIHALWQDHPSRIRFYMLIACLIWIPYTLAVSSYTGFVSQLVGIVGITMGVYRHDRHG